MNLIKHQQPDSGNGNQNGKSEQKWKVGIENLKNPKAFIDYSQTSDDIYENLEDYNPIKKRRVLIVFDDMEYADMESNKKLSAIVTKLFFKRKKTQYFTWPYITILFQSA